MLTVVNGQIVIELWPGDQGRFGVVAEPGLLLRFSGNVQYTYDLDTGTITEFSFRGRFTDICAALAA